MKMDGSIHVIQKMNNPPRESRVKLKFGGNKHFEKVYLYSYVTHSKNKIEIESNELQSFAFAQ